MKILILGATGGLAQVVIPVLLENPDNHLTLFARDTRRLSSFCHANVQLVQGDALNLADVQQAMSGQDLVYINLSGDLATMTRNVVQAMQTADVKRVILVSSMGIYGETPEDHGAILDPYRHSAKIIEQSGLDYTILRPAWFINDASINYQLTRKGEAFIGNRVSKRSIADLVAKIVAQPNLYLGESLGIAKR